MTTDGRTLGWNMIFFSWLCELVITLARPTSEPVPAVVGTATMGAMAAGVGTSPPIANVFKVPDWPRLPRHEGDHFAKVEAGAAAKGDDAVVAAVLIGCYSGGEVVLVGVGVDVAKDGAPEASARHEVQGACGDWQGGEPTICY